MDLNACARHPSLLHRKRPGPRSAMGAGAGRGRGPHEPAARRDRRRGNSTGQVDGGVPPRGQGRRQQTAATRQLNRFVLWKDDDFNLTDLKYS